MDKEKLLDEAIKQFCCMLPNINDLHHPNDKCRLMNVVYHLHGSSKVFSDIRGDIGDGLNHNDLFFSNEDMLSDFIDTYIEPEVISMYEHISFLKNLDLIK